MAVYSKNHTKPINILFGQNAELLYMKAGDTYLTKLKMSHYTPRRRLWERRYSSYSFLTSTLDGGERSASLLGRALPLGKGPPAPIG
jgi:hypothetical protein